MKTALLWLGIGMAIPCAAPGQNHVRQSHKTWADYGGGPDSSHFVALDQINK